MSDTPADSTLRAVIIGAGARGNQVFAELMRRNEIGWRVSAVVEPDALRRTTFAQRDTVCRPNTRF